MYAYFWRCALVNTTTDIFVILGRWMLHGGGGGGGGGCDNNDSLFRVYRVWLLRFALRQGANSTNTVGCSINLTTTPRSLRSATVCFFVGIQFLHSFVAKF
jgi:hypothetical protein